MVDLASLGEDDDEGARLITHPRHLEPGRGHRTPVHDLHPCVLRVEWAFLHKTPNMRCTAYSGICRVQEYAEYTAIRRQ
jgi:hypothetical protein